MYVFDDNLCPLKGDDLKVPVLCIMAHDFYKRLYGFMDNDNKLD